MGFTDPTPIQLRAFPIVLAGRDLIGTAQTGTGKTAAFALPILTNLAEHGALRCLVLEPTRELAAQVETAFRDYGRFTDLRVSLIHGGVGYGKQREEAAAGMDIVVATPGRLLDHLQQGTMKLDKVNVLVLDEVDRMLDMGFLPDIRRILARLPTDRQTMLFSATMPPEIRKLADAILRDPVTIAIDRSRPAAGAEVTCNLPSVSVAALAATSAMSTSTSTSSRRKDAGSSIRARVFMSSTMRAIRSSSSMTSSTVSCSSAAVGTGSNSSR